MNAISAILADVVRNARDPYAARRLLAPAIELTTPDPGACAFGGVVTGAVPDPPTPKWPPTVIGLVMFTPDEAVDVFDFARTNRLDRSAIARQHSVIGVVNWTSLVLAVGV